MKNFAKEYPGFPFLQVLLAKLQEMPILQARLAKFTVSADGEFVQVPLAQIFKPEILSKLNYYISAIDDLVKMPEDNPTIGISFTLMASAQLVGGQLCRRYLHK